MKIFNAHPWKTVLLTLLVGLAMVPTFAQAATVNAVYSNGTEVPLTAAGYTATGNTVNFTLNYAPALGASLMVVNNTGSNPIVGEFDNLANNAAVDLGFGGIIYRFVAYYHGGKGNNDLVLLWRGTGLAAWGENGTGQLGDNSSDETLVPVAVDQSGVLAGKTIVAVAAGFFHNLVLCTDGTIAAWGSNSVGELGDGSTVGKSVPAVVNQNGVLAGKTVVEIAAGGGHSLALCSDGTLVSWGRNVHGELGIGSTSNSQVATLVDRSGALSGKTVVGIAAGASHSLVLCSDGTIAAWGRNHNGQIGDNSSTDRLVPVAVDTSGVLAGKTVVGVGAGYFHSFALCSDGELAAWGTNSYGQLGDNSTTHRDVPVLVDHSGVLSGKEIVDVSGGYDHSLAACSDGTVVAWGANFSGRLGDGSTTQRNVPVLVDQSGVLSGKTVVEVAAADSHSLALCSDGTLTAWGNNTGQLGDGSDTSRDVPVLVDQSGVLAGTSVFASAGGVEHSVALVAVANPEIAVEIPLGTDLTDGAATIDFGTTTSGSSGVVQTFTIRNIGPGNLSGLSASIDGLNAGDFTVSASPIGPVTGGGWTTFEVRFAPTSPGGKIASLHLASNDADENPFDIDLTGTGSNVVTASFTTGTEVPLTTEGFSATGSTVNFTLNYAPVLGGSLMVVENTSVNPIVGEFDNLANNAPVDLSFDGVTYHFVAYYYGGDGYNDLVLVWRGVRPATWGQYFYGQLGNNASSNSIVPAPVDQIGVLAGKTVVSVAAGVRHNLVLCADGTLAAWGQGGVLGDNSSVQRDVPVLVDQSGVLSGKTVVAITAGDSHNLALCSDGTLAAWGSNFGGPLGNNSSASSLVPVAVDQSGVLAGKTIVALSGGGNHSLALCSDGTLVAWGFNSSGQLGDNSNLSRFAPVLVDQGGVLSGKTVVAVAAGYDHSAAVCSDGTVATWGENDRGQLGNDSTTPSFVPVLVDQSGALSGKNVVDIAAAGRFSLSHNLALCSDGSLVSWGGNSFGQLGDDSTTQRNAPVSVDQGGVLSGKTVIDIFACPLHSLALCSDGTIAAWGENSGRLGDNTSTRRRVPVLVEQSSAFSDTEFVALAGGESHSVALYAAVSDIAVELPSGEELTNGGASVDFGWASAAGPGVERTFTIRNAGPVELSDLSLSIDGPNSAGFSVTASPAGQVSVGESTTFKVSFSPVSLGANSATLHIASNDPDENPFDIALMGTSSPSLPAEYSTGTEVPLTRDGYTATGDAVDFTLNYAPAAGTTLMVVNNTSMTPIDGEFDNLANGAAVDLSFGGNTYPFVAWYYGGKGHNDLVLLWRDVAPVAWGRNTTGELGDNSTTDSRVPTEVDRSGIISGKTVVDISVGASHNLALCSDGTLAAWGKNIFGQVGDGSTVARLVPTAVDRSGVLSGRTVIAVATGNDHCLVLCDDGTLASWGWNLNGQLGDDSTSNRLVPVLVDQSGVLSGKTVVSIAAGTYHNLALCSDGTLAAWGANFSGQVGDNSTVRRQVPVLVDQSGVLFGKTVVAIAAGGDHSLALCSDGTTTAWGRNENGQLGDDSNDDRQVPVLVDQSGVLFGKTVVEIAAAPNGAHSLARCSDGTLAAWGRNSSGQLGVGFTVDRKFPVLVDQSGVLSGKTVTAIAAGGSHSLALCSDGSAAAWGANFDGRLGDNTTNQRSAPILVDQGGAFSGKPFVAIAGGSAHTLALYASSPDIAVEHPSGTNLTDGSSVIDFGEAASGVGAVERTFTVRNTDLGELTDLGVTIDGADAPDFFVSIQPASEVSTNDFTTFTIRFAPAGAGEKTATLHLANNDADENPFDISLIGNGSSMISADYTTGTEVALTTANYTASGSTVDLTLSYAPTPGTVLTVINKTGLGFIEGELDNLPNGAEVDLSFEGVVYHFVAHYYGGQGNNDLVLVWRNTGLASWGRNEYGQLGDNSTLGRTVAVAVDASGILSGKTVVAISGNSRHNFALCSDGTLAAWGDNSYGQLGDGSTVDRSAPVSVDQEGVLSGKTVVAIAGGSFHSVALCADGTLVSWGRNVFGQLGDGSNVDSSVPVEVDQTGVLFGKDIIDIAVGFDHTIVLCSDGSVATWGRNLNGQLGDGTGVDHSVPVVVEPGGVLQGKTVVAIAAGGNHCIAVCSDGLLAAWGENRHGQVGASGDFDRDAPTEVEKGFLFSLKRIVDVAAGEFHSLALCSDGSIVGWGSNYSGQLGDNSTVEHRLPVFVPQSGALSLRSVVAISAGSLHTLAVCSDGTIAAWGDNFYGQLGDGSVSERLIPVVANEGVLADRSAVAINGGSSHSLALYSTVPEITVGQKAGAELTHSATIHFPTGVLIGDPRDLTFTIGNRGLVELSNLAITIDGDDATDFNVVANSLPAVAAGASTTFTVRFLPSSLGVKNATLHIASNDPNTNPFDINLVGDSRPGAHLRIGEALDLDLSWVPLALGESLKVLGLPPGLVFNDGTSPSITGTALGLGGNKVVSIQILNGKTLIETIPLELSVEPARATSSYELLLEDGGQPVGKLRVTINNPSKRSLDPTFTATLERLGEKRRKAKGSFVASDSPQTVPINFPAFRTYPAVSFDLVITDDSDTVNAATNPASSITGRGFRLMRSGRIPAGNPALTLTLPPSVVGDRVTTPAGIGHANGKVTSKALVPLRGQLGDAQTFSTSLYLSSSDQAVVWLTPYKNKQSYLGGIIGIGDIASANRTASMDDATNGLQWKRESDAKEKSYPDGFGPLALDATSSHWVPTRKAEALAQSLGLYYRAIDVSFLAPTGDLYPDQLSLRDNSSLLVISPEDSVAFKGKATGKTGLFAGKLGLAAPANRSAVKGVFLQEESFGTLVGQGVVKIPIAGPVRGAFQTVGIELMQTAGPGTYSYKLGDDVNIDLSYIALAPEETLKVVGLPKGLTFSSEPTPMITGTALSYASTKGIQVQILNGRTVVQTIPLDLAIDPYTYAGDVEVLLEELGLPVGKLKVKIGNPTIKSLNPSYSATLERLGERRRVAKGIFAASDSPQTVTVVFPASRNLPTIRIDLILTEGSDLVTGTTNPASDLTARGFRLAKVSRIPYGNPTLTMALPAAAASDGVATPAGTGYATGKVTSKALAPVRGLLGDAQKFSSTLALSQTNQAVVWVTPYKNKQSYLGGITDLAEVGAAQRAASADSATAGLKWKLEADPKAKAYPDGFGPLDLDTLSNRWYPQRTAEALAQSLGLDFRAIKADYLAPTGDPLPTILSLRNNSVLLPLAPDDTVPFKGKAIGKTGTFNGRLRLPAPATNSAMSGVFLQDESNGSLIGLGLIKVPIAAPVRGSFRTSGVILSN